MSKKTLGRPSQGKRTAASIGEITSFYTSEAIDFVEGEAGQAYEGRLDRFTRRILFLKPDVIVVYDVVSAPEPSSFEWRLHAPTEMDLGDASATVVNGAAACDVDFLWPKSLAMSQTDKFDTPPRPRIKLVEYHLTNTPAEKSKTQTFVTVIRPYRSEGESSARIEKAEAIDGGYGIRFQTSSGNATVLLQEDGGGELSWEGMTSSAAVGEVVEREGDEPVRFERD